MVPGGEGASRDRSSFAGTSLENHQVSRSHRRWNSSLLAERRGGGNRGFRRDGKLVMEEVVVVTRSFSAVVVVAVHGE